MEQLIIPEMGLAEAADARKELIIPAQLPVNIMPEQFVTTMLKIHKLKIKSGYTLIELLVVIAIIGILTAIALVSYKGVSLSARDTKRKADLETIRSALQMCESDTDSYPLSLPAAGGSIICGGTVYLQSVPADPLGANYVLTSDGVTYTLCATLEEGGNFCVANP